MLPDFLVEDSRMKALSRTLFCALLILPGSLSAVSEATVLFLLIEPSTASTTPNNERVVGYKSWTNVFGLADDLLFHNPDENATARAGLELNLAEILSIRYGHYRDDSGDVQYHATGFGFELTGLVKFIAGGKESGSFWQKLNRHLVVQYNIAEYENDVVPLDGTKLRSFQISLRR